jgi:hypothetical protein
LEWVNPFDDEHWLGGWYFGRAYGRNDGKRELVLDMSAERWMGISSGLSLRPLTLSRSSMDMYNVSTLLRRGFLFFFWRNGVVADCLLGPQGFGIVAFHRRHVMVLFPTGHR